jgi:hypothetical protein
MVTIALRITRITITTLTITIRGIAPFTARGPFTARRHLTVRHTIFAARCRIVQARDRGLFPFAPEIALLSLTALSAQ